MNEKEIVENALQVAIPKVIESLQNQLTASLDHKITEAAENQIVNYVCKWMEENFIPIVGDRLMSIKDVLEKQSEDFCKKIAYTLFQAMLESFQKRMEHSWNRDTIIKSLFGG